MVQSIFPTLSYAHQRVHYHPVLVQRPEVTKLSSPDRAYPERRASRSAGICHLGKILSNGAIQAVAPPGTGTVDVRVVVPTGPTGGITVDSYTYVSIQSVSPSTGSTLGGTAVSITGTGLGSVRGVYFGNTAANFTQVSDTLIQAVSPPGQGVQDIRVATTFGGTTPINSSDRFTYTGSSVSGPSVARLLSAGNDDTTMRRIQFASASGGAVSAAVAVTQYIYKQAPLLSDMYTIVEKSIEAAKDVGTSCEGNLKAIVAGLALVAVPVVGAITAEFTPIFVAGELIDLAVYGLTKSALEPITDIAIGSIVESMIDTGIKAGVMSAFSGLCDSHNGLIDPSGTVIDSNGNPVSGATVSLLRADFPEGPFSSVDPTAPAV